MSAEIITIERGVDLSQFTPKQIEQWLEENRPQLQNGGIITKAEKMWEEIAAYWSIHDAPELFYLQYIVKSFIVGQMFDEHIPKKGLVRT